MSFYLFLSSFLREAPMNWESSQSGRDHKVVEDFLFLCLRRATFVQSHKSGEKDSLKNFSVILSVCSFTKDNGESLHPILLDCFGIFILVISTQSDKWKIFGWHILWKTEHISVIIKLIQWVFITKKAFIICECFLRTYIFLHSSCNSSFAVFKWNFSIFTLPWCFFSFSHHIENIVAVPIATAIHITIITI